MACVVKTKEYCKTRFLTIPAMLDEGAPSSSSKWFCQKVQPPLSYDSARLVPLGARFFLAGFQENDGSQKKKKTPQAILSDGKKVSVRYLRSPHISFRVAPPPSCFGENRREASEKKKTVRTSGVACVVVSPSTPLGRCDL